MGTDGTTATKRRQSEVAKLAQQRHLTNALVIARPPTAAYRFNKFVKQHRKSVAVAVGFVLLLIAATVIRLVLAIWANSERERAERATEADSRYRQQAVEQSGVAIAARQQKWLAIHR